MIIDRKYTNFPPKRELNPMQELFVPFIDGFNTNIVCVSPTGSGKTTVFTMLGTNFLEKGKSIIYIGSMKALVEEKRQDWADPNHVWNKYQMAIVTGDYKGKDRDPKHLNNADVIVMTPEAFMSALRASDDKSVFLHRVGAVMIDEFHLIGEEGRGANIEAALIEFTYDFPEVPIIAASATVPNAEQLGEWLQKLTGRATQTIRSTYRPVELKFHQHNVYFEEDRIDTIIDIVKNKHPDQQFLVGVFAKAFGKKLLRALQDAGVPSDFHYAQLSKDTKKAIEDGFDAGDIRALVCTSTLFTGVNKPAWGVIITNEKQGMELVPSATLQQLAGRAGRPQFHKEGHVFVLARPTNMPEIMRRLTSGEPVTSKLTEPNSIAAHFLAAVYMGRIKSLVHFHRWYSRSLACMQRMYTPTESYELAKSIAQDMASRGFLRLHDDGTIELTRYGTISAQMLVDPYELHDFVAKLGGYFALDNPQDSDVVAVFAQNRKWATPWALNDYEQSFVRNTDPLRKVDPRYYRSTIAFWRRIQGADIPEPFLNSYMVFKEDHERILQTLLRVDAEVKRWNRADDIKIMFARVVNGLDTNAARRVALKLSKTEQKNLAAAGISSADEIKQNLDAAKRIIGERRLREIGLAPKVAPLFDADIPEFGSI